MSVNLYSGTPGSGKSLRAAYKLIEWMKMGRRVIANFEIDETYFDKYRKRKKKLGEFVYCDNGNLTVKYLKDFAKAKHQPFKERQTLLIIDECAAMFNSRTYGRTDRMEWIDFFRLHRKLGYEVILISQSDRLIDRQIRAFIEMEYKHRAMKNYKTFGWILSLLCGGLFHYSEFWYGMNIKTNGGMFLLNRKKAKIYDTFKIFDMEDKKNDKDKKTTEVSVSAQNAEPIGQTDCQPVAVPVPDSGVQLQTSSKS